MTDTPARPPYRAALLVALAVLAGYALTLAPTVTFWDAGELIAATKILGIPHPPGTPLLVLLGHAWATLVPVGEWAFRTNLMTAAFGAAAAGLLFLAVHESIGALGGPRLRVPTAAVAAVLGAFSFTNWQNATETEAYAVAVFMIAAMTWTAFRWRAAPDAAAAQKRLLLILLVMGLAVGNHLLALLAGPAIVGFLAWTVHATPARDLADRRRAWAQVAVVAGTWALLVGTGLGNATLATLGALLFLAAAVFAFASGAAAFAVMALVVAAIGITPYYFLYVRSGQAPMINEAAPGTWDALLAVIRREQYPVRTPLDDPTVFHGPENPGRSLTIIGLQLANYFQYFVWQWGKTLPELLRAIVAAAVVWLGVAGWRVQRAHDRGASWLFTLLFLVTGLGLVAYMNFRPGFSIGWEQFPRAEDHEVRERDYFFVASFVTWGLWTGIGLGALARRVLAGAGERARPAAWAVLALALVPVAGNWGEATRRGPDRRLAADFAYNLLNSVPPYGVLFTYGDNDTFPLWWAQEVAGVRRDVTIVCLALAQTDWYMRQLRDNPVRDFDPAAAPVPWRDAPAVKPDWPLHTMTDGEIANATSSPVLLDRPTTIGFGPLSHTFPARTVFYPNDIVAIRIIQQNIGRRPIVWGVTSGRDFSGLADYVVQQGLAFRLETARPDTTRPGLVQGGVGGGLIDVPLTRQLAWETYRYGPLLTEDARRLESTSASIAATLSIPFSLLAYADDVRGDTTSVVKQLRRAQQIAPSEALDAALEAYGR